MSDRGNSANAENSEEEIVTFGQMVDRVRNMTYDELNSCVFLNYSEVQNISKIFDCQNPAPTIHVALTLRKSEKEEMQAKATQLLVLLMYFFKSSTALLTMDILMAWKEVLIVLKELFAPFTKKMFLGIVELYDSAEGQSEVNAPEMKELLQIIPLLIETGWHDNREQQLLRGATIFLSDESKQAEGEQLVLILEVLNQCAVLAAELDILNNNDVYTMSSVVTHQVGQYYLRNTERTSSIVGTTNERLLSLIEAIFYNVVAGHRDVFNFPVLRLLIDLLKLSDSGRQEGERIFSCGMLILVLNSVPIICHKYYYLLYFLGVFSPLLKSENVKLRYLAAVGMAKLLEIADRDDVELLFNHLEDIDQYMKWSDSEDDERETDGRVQILQGASLLLSNHSSLEDIALLVQKYLSWLSDAPAMESDSYEAIYSRFYNFVTGKDRWEHCKGDMTVLDSAIRGISNAPQEGDVKVTMELLGQLACKVAESLDRHLIAKVTTTRRKPPRCAYLFPNPY